MGNINKYIKIGNRKDIFPLILLQLTIFAIVLVIKPTHLNTSLLVYGTPVLFLLSKQKHEKLKLVIFSAIAAMFMFGVIDVLAVAGNSWQVQQAIPFRYLGYSYWGNIIWSFGLSLFILLFYKHFSERDIDYKISKNWKMMAIFLLIYNGLLYAAYFFDKELLILNYAYLFVGTVTIVPFLIFFYIKNKEIFSKALFASIYIGVFTLIYELVAVHIGNWWFPGEYIGTVKIFNIKFPLEELIFWIILTTPSLIAFYEFFIEDNK